MEYRNLGRTGVKVSALSLGCWVFGDRVMPKEGKAIIAASLDAGINFIDTANYYGRPPGASEDIIGDALRESGKRDRVILATKVYQVVDASDPNGRGVSRRHIIAECEKSLRHLKTDYIDLYYLHRLDPQVAIDEPLRALDDLCRSGKVRYIGASTSPAWSFVESLWASKELGLNRFIAETPPYNLLDRSIEREVVPMAQTFGVAINPWTPLAGELLAGGYKRGKPAPPGSRGADPDPRHVRLQSQRFNERVFDVLDVLEPMAKEKSCTVAELALAWVLRQPGITSPIVGMEHVAEVASTLKALDVNLTPEDHARIDKVSPPNGAVSSFYNTEPANFAPHPHRF
jgi:aryl-alcohol dehydrogenase-like predicted oxidoreductase